MKKVLELFAGSRSIGRQAELLGMEVLSVDKFVTEGMHILCAVEDLTEKIITEKIGEPDIIWASPCCNAWSKTGWFHYWDTKMYKFSGQFIAKRRDANDSVEMVRKTIEIFSWFPKAYFFMENPEGMLQKHPVIKYFELYGLIAKKELVTYCQYGGRSRKPTHIWTNCESWEPAHPCRKGDKCHDYAPRNSQKGTRGQGTSFNKSKIPNLLCREILLAADKGNF